MTPFTSSKRVSETATRTTRHCQRCDDPLSGAWLSDGGPLFCGAPCADAFKADGLLYSWPEAARDQTPAADAPLCAAVELSSGEVLWRLRSLHEKSEPAIQPGLLAAHNMILELSMKRGRRRPTATAPRLLKAAQSLIMEWNLAPSVEFSKAERELISATSEAQDTPGQSRESDPTDGPRNYVHKEFHRQVLSERDAEIERLKRALGEVGAHADRCEECDCGEAKIATQITRHPLHGLPIFLCDEHADETRAQYRKAESKGCGKQPEVEPHEQSPEVEIALRALGEWPSPSSRDGSEG